MGTAEVEGMPRLWDANREQLGERKFGGAEILIPLGTATPTWIHSRSSSPWKPVSVRQDGSRITWANAVTSSVVSVPSTPCTSTLASFLQEVQRPKFVQH